ncbi:MAG: glycosyl hydrolase-related protein [Chloroflexi bacterium]|nr:glycosyl hydrolase-related protein [Chloroflexota bacterium]
MDRLFIIPHTHYDAVVFKTRAEYLEMGLPIILHALQALQDDSRYRFVLDQVCYIRPFLERYPEQESLFRRLLAEGRLQITCGMDTMADVNIPSGESFVRQVLYGKGYCQHKLGIDVSVGWALDTFGHHPQMPQLLCKSGFTSYFFARGVPWPPPEHAEFIWQGIDGSRIPALWLPYSYGFLFGSPHNLEEFSSFMRGRYAKLKPISATENLLGPSGVDLGEPEPHICELAEQFNAQADAPCKLVIATPDEFLQALNAATTSGESLSTISADLNPVFQGCYSSRIEVKQANRACEALLTSVERFAALAAVLGKPCDTENVWRAWEPVLFNQFHDCICGVQVDKVYDDTMRGYEYARRLGAELLEERLNVLAADIDTQGAGVPIIVWNTQGWQRDDVVEVEVSFAETGVTELCLQDPEGNLAPVQVLNAERHQLGGYKTATILFIARDVPALGHVVYHLLPKAAPAQQPEVRASSSEQSAFSAADDLGMPREHGCIENAYYRLEFDVWSGALVSLKHKDSGYEYLREPGNVVARESDYGDFWQLKGALKAGMATAGAQRQPPPSPGKAVLTSQQVGDGSVRAGPLMAEFNISHPFDSGWFKSRVRVYNGIKRIDLHTEITNQEQFVRYRVLFPTTIEKGTITHEIPFGAVERPAQELPAQNWIDYSSRRYGLTLINRGIPGNNVDGDTLMLSILRASQLVAYAFSGGYEPGVGSTTGQELGKTLPFDYALIPHQASWREEASYQQGLAFNNPLIARKATQHAGSLPPRWGFISIKPGHVVLSAFKVGADGLVVVRVYEAEGHSAIGVELRFSADIIYAEETNLIEDSLGALTSEGHLMHFNLGPFEIKTFRVKLVRSSTKRNSCMGI